VVSRPTGPIASGGTLPAKEFPVPEIILTKGCTALVDSEDYPRVLKYSWYAVVKRNTTYAASRINGKVKKLHQFLLGFPVSQIDHVNGDGLDNRKTNLRLCSQGQNICGVRKKTNRSGFVGVSCVKSTGKFIAQISKEGKCWHLGTFKTAREAAVAYDQVAQQLYGSFARLNLARGK